MRMRIGSEPEPPAWRLSRMFAVAGACAVAIALALTAAQLNQTALPLCPDRVQLLREPSPTCRSSSPRSRQLRLRALRWRAQPSPPASSEADAGDAGHHAIERRRRQSPPDASEGEKLRRARQDAATYKQNFAYIAVFWANQKVDAALTISTRGLAAAVELEAAALVRDDGAVEKAWRPWPTRATPATKSTASSCRTRPTRLDCNRWSLIRVEDAMVHRRAVITGTVLGGALSALAGRPKEPAAGRRRSRTRIVLEEVGEGRSRHPRRARQATHVLGDCAPSASRCGRFSGPTASFPTSSRSAATSGSGCTTGTCGFSSRSLSAGPPEGRYTILLLATSVVMRPDMAPAASLACGTTVFRTMSLSCGSSRSSSRGLLRAAPSAPN